MYPKNLFLGEILNINPDLSPTTDLIWSILNTHEAWHGVMCTMDADGMANNENGNWTAERSDLGLHCLPRPMICPKLSLQ